MIRSIFEEHLFSEPSALAAGFEADDSTYLMILKCEPIRGQRTSIGRTLLDHHMSPQYLELIGNQFSPPPN